MVIGFDGSRAFRIDRTGTENYSYQLLKALAKIDRKNQYIVYIRPQVDLKDNWPNNFQFSILNFQFLWTQAGLALETFRQRLDVLFVPAHTLPLIRRPGLKTVVTVHDLGLEYLPQMHQIKQRLYLSFMQRFQLKTATKIIAVSKATKADLVKRLGINAEKVEVVYEGYDKKLFKVTKTTKYDSLRPYFLFVGTVQPRKNLERIIKAFKMYLSRGPASSVSRRASSLANRSLRLRGGSPSSLSPLESLIIVGSKGWLSDEIYELPKKLGIEDKVKFLGYVPDQKLPALYSGARALVFPSLFEGFGLPILEAQACGCPVITSNISSMAEVAGKGAILVDPYSVDDIVRGMREIGEIRGRLIKKGFENIKRFSWGKCAVETLDVLTEVSRIMK